MDWLVNMKKISKYQYTLLCRIAGGRVVEINEGVRKLSKPNKRGGGGGIHGGIGKLLKI